MKERFSQFSDKKNGWWPFYLQFWVKLTPFEQKTPNFNRYLIVALQP